MSAHLKASISNNPSDAKLEHVLPGVQDRFQNLDSCISSGFVAQALAQNVTNTKVGNMDRKFDQFARNRQQEWLWIQQVLQHASISCP